MLGSTPEEIVESKENSVLFWRTIWTMPLHLRRVITHLYICDRSLEEAAALMEITVDTVKLLHHMAIDNLRARI